MITYEPGVFDKHHLKALHHLPSVQRALSESASHEILYEFSTESLIERDSAPLMMLCGR